jgi:hypothetical protein
VGLPAGFGGKKDLCYLTQHGFSAFNSMKTILIPSFACLLAISLPAQTIGPVSGQSSAETIVGYQIGQQDGNSRVWQKIVKITDEQGNFIFQTNAAYVELASGLNYWASNQWQAAKEEIDGYAGGAIAQFGQHKVIFANNLNTAGAIDLQTPDGKELRSHVLGLSYYDSASGKTVLIAQVKDCQGQIVGSNQVVYADAFEGVSADAQYIYRRGSFEQNVILKSSPPAPESFGLNSTSTVLQVLTEFDGAPTPNVTVVTNQIRSTDALTDEFLDFGVMKMVPGKAFVVGQNPLDGVRVAKQWTTVNGRTILVEAVKIPAILSQLNQLPVSQQTNVKPMKNSVLNVVSTKPLLPALKVARSTKGKMKLARAGGAGVLASRSSKGLVLDYVTVNTSQSGYYFQGDTTYYISGTLTMSGTTTFEGGAVLKYAANASLNFYYGASIVWQGAPYHPVVLTAKDDNSVGQTISGSTGNPTFGAYANPALKLNDASSYSTIANFRIAYAQQAIYLQEIAPTFYDGQIVNCLNGIYVGLANAYLRNLLFANVETELNDLDDADVDVQNVTFGGYNASGGWLMSAQVAQWNASFKNCIIANCAGGFVNGPLGNLTGDHDGYYNDNGYNNGIYQYPKWETYDIPDYYGNPFQTVGAGNYYSTDAGFRYSGTPNIDIALISDLIKKTTFPPFIPNATVPYSTGWGQTASRDTYAPFYPDLGYHYDPLDYLLPTSAFGETISSGVTLTLANGVAVGMTSQYGFILNSGSTFISQGGTGTGVNPLNQVVWYQTVQEQPVSFAGSRTATAIFNPSVNSASSIQASFTDFSMLGYRLPFFSSAIGPQFFSMLSLNNCQLRDVNLTVGGQIQNGNCSQPATVTLQNNLWERSTVSLFNGCVIYSQGSQYFFYQNPLVLNAYNNTFWQCTNSLTYDASGAQCYPAWTIADNLFDGGSTSFSGNGNYAGHINASHDAYETMPSQLRGPGDQTLSSSVNYAAGPLGIRYIGSTSPINALISSGSRSASDAGLADYYTILADQIPDGDNGDGHYVDIGFHYPVDINAVSITPGSNAIRPNGSDPGETGYFFVNNSGQDFVTVYYTISGTAQNGVDYNTISGAIVVPPGGNEIFIHPIADSQPEFDKTVTLTLTPNNLYSIDPQNSSATILIIDNPSTIFTVVTSLNSPVGIDYDPTTNALIVSVEGGFNSQPYNFVRVGLDSSGELTINNWSEIQGLTDEVKLHIAKSTANGFTIGQMFFSNNGAVNWVGELSPDATTFNLLFAELINDTYIRGGLYIDQSGSFSGDLIAVTGDHPDTGGGVWRIKSSGVATRLADINDNPYPHLEGVITLTNDLAKWGPWAGKILTGAESAVDQNNNYDPMLYTIDPNGSVTPYDTMMMVLGGIGSEDFDLIPTNQDLYCVNEGNNTIEKVSSTLFNNYVGDLLITQSGDGSYSATPKLFIISWNNSAGKFIIRSISHPNRNFEHVTFAPISLPSQPLQ